MLIRSVALARHGVVSKLDRALAMDLHFRVGQWQFARLKNYLGRIIAPTVLTVG